MLDNNLHDKLRSLGRHIIPPAPAISRHQVERYHLLARTVGGELVQSESGAFVAVSQLFLFGFQYGEMLLEKSFSEDSIPLSAFLIKDGGKQISPSQLVFIDTETTGLGGAGTVPFLVGVGRFVSEGFEVRQYLLPDYSDERAMLDRLLSDLDDTSVIVTYNGAAFDIPIIQDRVIINRCDETLQFESQVDVLHAARRLFRRRLKDCSLMNLEKALFAYERGDDIPGYLVPSVFFDWVSAENCSQMNSVLGHNRHDILSLCLLFFHLKGLFESNGMHLIQVDDLYSLSRLYGRRQEHHRSLTASERITDIAGEAVAGDILLHQGFVCKRLGQFEKAAEFWTALANADGLDSRVTLRADEELAKLFEHQLRDFARAEYHAERHIARLGLCPAPQSHLETAAKRLERIRRKRSKS